MLSADLYDALLDGAAVTIRVTAAAAVWGTLVAVAFGVGSLSPVRPLRWAIRVYVEVFRGVSSIILLFWVYYSLPLFGVEVEPMTAGVLALGLNLSAYGTEVVRGAMQAVPRGQREAATAVNLSRRQTIWSIELPQAAVTALPPYGSLLIEILKVSALVSLVNLADITYEAQNLRLNRADDPVDIFVAVLVLYFGISLAIMAVTRLLERYVGRGLTTGRQA